MDIAFIQHAQHDIHGYYRSQHQPQGIAERGLEGHRRTLELGTDAAGHLQFRFRLADQIHRFFERYA